MDESPLLIDAWMVRAALPFDRLVPALREAFRAGVTVPLRPCHDLPRDASLLLMPAWNGTSALAGSLLARDDAKRLLIVESGHVAGQLAQAWRAPIASR